MDCKNMIRTHTQDRNRAGDLPTLTEVGALPTELLVCVCIARVCVTIEQ